jgi:hypothetical protein
VNTICYGKLIIFATISLSLLLTIIYNCNKHLQAHLQEIQIYTNIYKQIYKYKSYLKCQAWVDLN